MTVNVQRDAHFRVSHLRRGIPDIFPLLNQNTGKNVPEGVKLEPGDPCLFMAERLNLPVKIGCTNRIPFSVGGDQILLTLRAMRFPLAPLDKQLRDQVDLSPCRLGLGQVKVNKMTNSAKKLYQEIKGQRS